MGSTVDAYERLAAEIARAAIAAISDHAALVGDGTAVAYNNGYKHAAEKFGAELTTLRTQLAASRALNARASEELRMISMKDSWALYDVGLRGELRAALKGTQP